MLFPLLGHWTTEKLQNKSKLTVYWLTFSVVAILLFGGVLSSQAATGWLKQARQVGLPVGNLHWRHLIGTV